MSSLISVGRLVIVIIIVFFWFILFSLLLVLNLFLLSAPTHYDVATTITMLLLLFFFTHSSCCISYYHNVAAAVVVAVLVMRRPCCSPCYSDVAQQQTRYSLNNVYVLIATCQCFWQDPTCIVNSRGDGAGSSLPASSSARDRGPHSAHTKGRGMEGQEFCSSITEGSSEEDAGGAAHGAAHACGGSAAGGPAS